MQDSLYHQNKARGVCGCCGQRPPREGIALCAECAEANRLACKRNYGSNKKKGLCFCGNPRVCGRSRCWNCIDAGIRFVAGRKQRGICLRCVLPAEPNRTVCREHGIEARIRRLDVLPEEKIRARTAVAMFNGVCQNSGCGARDPGGKHGWQLDHDHRTKRFRAILCVHCNTLLGHAKDNPHVLAGAIEYINKFSGD